MSNLIVSYANDSVVNRPRSLVTWEGLATAGTHAAFTVAGQSGLVGAAQISGTFGGATVSLEYSNDGVTWFQMTDVAGAAILTVANALYEFSTAALYIKPVVAGGAGDDVDVILVLRG